MKKSANKAKGRQLRFREVPVNPFKIWIQIAIGDDVHTTANRLAELCKAECDFAPSPSGRACFSIVPDVDKDNMWKFITAKPSVRVEELAHECFHAVVYLSSPEGRGAPINLDSGEMWAYIYEALLKDVIAAYKSLGGKIQE